MLGHLYPLAQPSRLQPQSRQWSSTATSAFYSVMGPPDQSSINRCVLELTQSLCQEVNENQAQTRALVHSSQTPTVQLDTFDGNPLNYCRFIDAFGIMVRDDEIPLGHKLQLLLQYCKGDTREALEGCEVIADLKAADSKARTILKRHFSDGYTVAQTFIKKIQDYPKVLEGGLRNRNRFRNTKNRSIREFRRHPKLHDIVSFLQNVTDEITDSVYGALEPNSIHCQQRNRRKPQHGILRSGWKTIAEAFNKTAINKEGGKMHQVSD